MVVIHVGLFKTATTTLQRQFFPRLPDCTVLTREGDKGTLFRVLANNLCHAADRDYLGETFRSLVGAALEGASGSVLLTYEAFSGAIYNGMYNFERNAQRLYDLAPSARILLVIRQQAGMIRSLHNYYIQKGGFASLAEFVENRAVGCDFDVDHLCYDQIIARYQELFGREHVKVLPYELLVADAAGFLNEIAVFVAGVTVPGPVSLGRVNQALSPVSSWTLRHSNRLFRQSRYNPRPRLASMRRAHALRRFLQQVVDPALFGQAGGSLARRDEQLLDALLPRFAASNAEVERLTGLSLAQWSYPLAAPSAKVPRPPSVASA
jgi:hypothetical protein